MTIPYQDFSSYQGNTELLSVEILKTDGTPLNLSGARIDWVVSKHPDQQQTSAVIIKSTDVQYGGITIINPTLGLIEILIEAQDTRMLESYKYYHECRVGYSGTYEYKTVFTGSFTLNPSAHFYVFPGT